MFALICYDVPARRTETYRKLLSQYLTHEQNSVFMGRLTEATFRTLVADLSAIARPGDRLMSVTAENQNNVRVGQLRKNEGNGAFEKRPAQTHERGFDIV